MSSEVFYNREVNILSAIYAGQTGFLSAGNSLATRAQRIADFSSGSGADDQLAEDMVGMKVDKIAAEANLRTIKVSDGLLQELVQNALKKD